MRGTRREMYALELFDLFDGSDTMIWSKETTSKSCDKKSSHQTLQNQKHQIPKLLNSNSKNSQKRKCKQYINGENFATNFELVGKKNHCIDNAKNHKRKPSLISCSTPSNGKKISLLRRGKYGSLAQNDMVEFCAISRQDYSHLSDDEVSAKQPNHLMNEESFYIHTRDLMENNSYSYSITTSIKEKLKEEDMEFVDSRKKFLPSRANHLPRPFVPIGPRFQAEVLEWETTTNIKQYNSDACLKWLGTQIWPIPSLSRNNEITIEKGRLDSNSSENLKSVNGVKKHNEDGNCLKSKVNDAFSSWKFDKKKDVSKSWKIEDEKKFESLEKLNMLLSDKSFESSPRNTFHLNLLSA